MTLHWVSALDRLDLLAEPVALAVRHMEEEVRVAEIDPDLADTAAFCDTFGVAMDASANCVVVAARRGGEVRYAACMVLATTRADVNGVVRKHLDARKASFAPMDDAVSLTGMEYGGITPLGLPDDWPILVDARVAAHPDVVIGSGVRHSKLALPGAALAGLKTAEVLDLAN
ncbi:YbaK/EbsC family protein [Nonomuraea sp. NPDC003804]|uniref:YbaK/EbsC family protein n=1 Tax=Nonomuraea sp. NPDC003804 TaxID=3154547 RepID=UPI0033AD5DA3